MRDIFNLSFRATSLEARQASTALSEWLNASCLPCVRVDEVEIAMAEAINNVVEHAYAGAEPGLIRVSCEPGLAQLDIHICDDGVPLPQNRMPPGLAADITVSRADLPEGGFGWFLIRKLTSSILYERRGTTNHLSLRFDLRGSNG